MIASHTVPLIVVVFGRPGAGKTTVSEEAVRLLNTKTCSVETAATANYLHLDLDVCVPQWMRVSISRLYYVNILYGLAPANNGSIFISSRTILQKGSIRQFNRERRLSQMRANMSMNK